MLPTSGADEAGGSQPHPEQPVLEAVAKAENIEITDERVDEEIAKMAEQLQDGVEKLKEMMGDYEISQMRSDLAVQAAVQLVTDSCR